MSQDRYYEALYDPETGGMTLKPKWRDNGPGYARAAGTRGELVTGTSEAEERRAAQRVRDQVKRDAA